MVKLMSDQIHSSSLYTDSSFLRGMARVADLFDTMNRYNSYNIKKDPDYEALKRDWGIIGGELHGGIEQYRVETELAEEGNDR